MIVGVSCSTIGIAISRNECIFGGKENPIEFIFKNTAQEDTLVFYYLNHDVPSLLKLMRLNENDLQTLRDKEKLYKPPYKVTYFSGSFFGLDEGFGVGHNYANFYDTWRYREEDHYDSEDTPESVKERAKIAKQTATEVLTSFNKLGIKEFGSSPVNAFIKRYPLHIPGKGSVPQKAMELSYKHALDNMNWTECWKLGHYDSFDVDLNGAYMYELSRLLDLRYGKWVQSNTIPENARYGILDGQITTRENFHPYSYHFGDMFYTPIDSWETPLYLEQYKNLYIRKQGYYEIKDGYFWIPDKEVYFLSGVIRWLQTKKESFTGLDRDIVKRIGVGIWGLLLLIRGVKENTKLGDNFNSFYGGLVQSNVRLRLSNMCLDNNLVPIHLVIDGATLERKPNLNFNTELGGWKLAHEGKCFSIGSGAVALQGKQGKGDFALDYDWLLEQIKENPEADRYTMKKYSVAGISDKRFGEIVETERTVVIGQDAKRLWKDYPKYGQDLLKQFDSIPRSANEIRAGGLIGNFIKS